MKGSKVQRFKGLLIVLLAVVLVTTGCGSRIVEGTVLIRHYGVPDAYHLEGDKLVVDGTHCEAIIDVNGTIKTFIVDQDACVTAWARVGKTIRLDCGSTPCVLADQDDE